MSATEAYERQLQSVREFFADPGDVPPTIIQDGLSSYSVKIVARELELSETRAGDILVDLNGRDELMRFRYGRAFVYRRPRSPVPSPEATPHADGDGTASPPDIAQRLADSFPEGYRGNPNDVTVVHHSTETLVVAGHEPGVTAEGGEGACAATLEDCGTIRRCSLPAGHEREHFADDPHGGITWALGPNELGADASPPGDPGVAAALDVLRDNHGKAYCGAWTDPKRNVIEMTAALHLEQEGVVRLSTRRSYTVAELVDVDVAG